MGTELVRVRPKCSLSYTDRVMMIAACGHQSWMQVSQIGSLQYTVNAMLP